MDIKTAQEIAQLRCNGHWIEAIKGFRLETMMNLGNAKQYLEIHSKNGQDPDKLFQQLCDDFVQNKRDLLVLAIQQQRELVAYIEQLTDEISKEETERPHDTIDEEKKETNNIIKENNNEQET